MNTSDRFRSRFQIGKDTGISHDFFNIIVVLDTDVILNPIYQKRSFKSESEMKEYLLPRLRKLKTYSEYTKEVVERHNAPHKDGSGNISLPNDPVAFEDFIGDGNIDTIRKLDEIVSAMKELGTSLEKLDIRALIDFMYRASLLIYGIKEEDKLKKRFCIA